MAIRASLLACVLACGVTILAANPASAGHYTYTQLAVGVSQFACAGGINDQNHVVGGYSGGANYGGFVYYPSGSLVKFPTPHNTELFGPCLDGISTSNINNKDLTVNAYVNAANHSFGPFTYNPVNGHTKKLPSAARLSMPTAINSSGTVVGAASGGPDATEFIKAHGFIISNGVLTEFDPPDSTNTTPTGIADDGTVVGYFADATGTHGFISGVNGTYTVVDWPGSTDTEILSINSAGEVAGQYFDAAADYDIGFTRSGTNLVSYHFPGALDTWVVATLTNGMRIGNYRDTSFVLHGFMYLGGQYTTLDPPGATNFSIQAVNSKGNFVGNTDRAFDGQAYLAICPPGTGICVN